MVIAVAIFPSAIARASPPAPGSAVTASISSHAAAATARTARRARTLPLRPRRIMTSRGPALPRSGGFILIQPRTDKIDQIQHPAILAPGQAAPAAPRRRLPDAAPSADTCRGHRPPSAHRSAHADAIAWPDRRRLLVSDTGVSYQGGTASGVLRHSPVI